MRHALGGSLVIALAFLSPYGAHVGFSSGGEQLPVVQAKPAAKDSFGDPLPEGVLYRLGTVRLRHQHTAALIFSADGSQLLSQGTTPDLRVWDVATGRILQQLAAAPEGRTRLIASPDDRHLACVRGNSYHVLLLDKATGKELAHWEHNLTWHSLTFSRDGKELVGLTGEEKTIVKWSIADRKEISRQRLDMTKVDTKYARHYWTLSPDGGIAAYKPSAGEGAAGTPWHFWDTITGKQCRPPLETKGTPDQVHWSADGRMIAVVGSDNTVKVWDTVAGKRLPLEAGNRQAEGSSYSPRGAAFHPKGKLLAVANNGTVAMWDVDTGKKLWGKELSGDILAFSPGGKTLAVGSGMISLVDTATGELVGFSRRDPGWFDLVGWEHSPSFLRDGGSFTVYDAAGISQLETATGKRLRTYHSWKNGWYSFGRLGDHGRLLACMGADEHDAAQIFMFEAATGKELWRRPQHPSNIYFARDGKKIAALSWKQDVFTMMDAATGREIKKVSVPSYNNDSGTLTAVSDDLHQIATTQNFQKIDLWDLDSGKKLRTLEGPEGHGELFFLPGSRLLVAAPDRRYHAKQEKRVWTRVWEVATGRLVRSFDEPLLKTSADGRWLALQGDKGLVIIRHLQSGRLVATVGESAPLAFSPDGSLVAVRDKSWHEVGLWDTFTGRQVCRYVDPMCEFSRAAFSPDGRTLVLTVRGGGSMLVCDVTGMASNPGKVPSQELSPAEADRFWLELTSDDGPRSQRARWSLVAGGKHTIKMLVRCLPRVEPVDGKNVAALIAALDSDTFTERQKASRVLEQMELARPALEEALKRNPSLEMKRRIEQIMAKQDGLPWDMEMRRALRGVLLLEQIGTPPARQFLQTLASGAAGSLLTQEAQAALQRLVPADRLH